MYYYCYYYCYYYYCDDDYYYYYYIVYYEDLLWRGAPAGPPDGQPAGLEDEAVGKGQMGCVCIYMYMRMYIYIYIYRERERERERGHLRVHPQAEPRDGQVVQARGAGLPPRDEGPGGVISHKALYYDLR